MNLNTIISLPTKAKANNSIKSIEEVNRRSIFGVVWVGGFVGWFKSWSFLRFRNAKGFFFLFLNLGWGLGFGGSSVWRFLTFLKNLRFWASSKIIRMAWFPVSQQNGTWVSVLVRFLKKN
jgi:hypothetical protein